ncbi:MAG: NAD(P)H-hydrate dehydratase [Proteobacteria bacterium]|nr:MAG: NAD(P)H-hydrate dehydratase [Pseudomonadota bacterium]
MRKLPRSKPKIRPVKITDKLLRAWALPKPAREGDKEARGAALIIAGADGMPGAAILPATAALRAGAGKLQIATEPSVAPWVALGVLEAAVIALPDRGQKKERAHFFGRVKRAGAVLVGPGMDQCESLSHRVAKIVPHLREAPLVLDAGALGCFEHLPACLDKIRGRVIITPHAGEMAKIIGRPKEEILADPASVALRFAKERGVITILKGSRTYIAGVDGTLYYNEAGNVGLATSGSGDILAGIITGLCARGAEPLQAAVWGVYLHATAGDALAARLGPLGYLARELLPEIPGLMRRLGPKA